MNKASKKISGYKIPKSDAERYRNHTVVMLNELDSERDAKFLCRVWIILKRHIERKGGIA